MRSDYESISKFIGVKFNRITVLGDFGMIKNSHYVLGKCECGIEKKFKWYEVKSGGSKSCGCLQKEVASKILTEATKTHGLSDHPLYGIWCNIKRRCTVEAAEFYEVYGGVGVRVCEEWMNDFKPFYDWCIENGWRKGLEVDKDLKSPEKPGKMYSPEFCSIVTHLVNSRNKTTTQFITYEGQTHSVQEWAEKLNLPYKAVWGRLKSGWTIERMINEPGLVEHKNILTYKGEEVGITELSRRFNITVGSIKKRLKKGWSIEKALETPVSLRHITNKKIAA